MVLNDQYIYLLLSNAQTRFSSGGSLRTFRRNMLPPSYDPEGGGSMFLRNVGELLPNYTASHTRRQ
jgi:hypothetical protein